MLRMILNRFGSYSIDIVIKYDVFVCLKSFWTIFKFVIFGSLVYQLLMVMLYQILFINDF